MLSFVSKRGVHGLRRTLSDMRAVSEARRNVGSQSIRDCDEGASLHGGTGKEGAVSDATAKDTRLHGVS